MEEGIAGPELERIAGSSAKGVSLAGNGAVSLLMYHLFAYLECLDHINSHMLRRIELWYEKKKTKSFIEKR